MNAINDNSNVDISNRLVQALDADGETVPLSIRFASIKTSIGKVDLVTDLLKQYNLLPKYFKDVKDIKRSIELRKKGNHLFGLKKDEEALEKYTYSVASAPYESEELALAYANRSAVFFKEGLYQDCLKDIDRALQLRYPDTLSNKLIARKKEAIKLNHKEKKHPHHQTIPSIPQEQQNPKIECASNSVEIKADPIIGRHIIATKDIAIGEVISVEEPCFRVLTDRIWCHCHHCLTLCYSLIPCQTCTQALFCSRACRDDARKYHDFECPILLTINSLDLNAARVLPLRIAIVITMDFKTLVDDIDKPDEIYRSARYKEIHGLVTNMELRKPSNLFERVTTVALFYYLVKEYTEFFTDSDQDKQNNFRELVLRHLQIMACNFHSIDELEYNSKCIYEPVTIGSGAYGFSSLFNHSCAPTVERRHYGSKIVLSALESIKKGDQLFENYGYHFAMHTKPERQAALRKQYFFDCNCRACENNWGTFDTLPHISSDSNLLILYYEKLAQADLETAREIKIQLTNALQELEKCPSKNLCELQELWKQCHAIDGNIRRVLREV